MSTQCWKVNTKRHKLNMTKHRKCPNIYNAKTYIMSTHKSCQNIENPKTYIMPTHNNAKIELLKSINYAKI